MSVFTLLPILNAFLLNPMLLHPISERLAADVQVLGRMCLIAVEFIQCSNEQLLLDAFKTNALGRQFELQRIDGRPISLQEVRQVAQGDLIATGENRNTLNNVLQ